MKRMFFLLVLVFVALSGVAIPGCEFLQDVEEKVAPVADKVAQATTQAQDSTIVEVVASTVPWGHVAVEIAGAVAALWLAIRGRQWKHAFTTVVRTVEPFIPSGDTERERLRVAQGEAVTALVKAAKK